ncbi:hypothetical protein Tco_0587379, partial [Tanacetum coccineum]
AATGAADMLQSLQSVCYLQGSHQRLNVH